MSISCNTLFAAAVFALTVTSASAWADSLDSVVFDNVRGASWETPNGQYVVHLDGVPAALKSGEVQQWCIRVTDTKGKPASSVKLKFEGGMPQHGHGLPNFPAVSANARDTACPFRINGVEFHMPGVWQIGFELKDRKGSRQSIKRFVNVI